MQSSEAVLEYLKEDRRIASLDVDKYASAITEQNKQVNASMAIFMEMFKGLSADVKDLASKVEENTRVTTHFEAQRDTLTACLVEIRKDLKESEKRLTKIELDQAVTANQQRANRDYSAESQGWLKWVIGGVLTAILAGSAALIRSLSS